MQEFDSASTRLFSRAVQGLMRRHEYSGAQLAKLAQVSQKTISNVVRDNSTISPTLDTVDRIAAAFKLASWQLISPDFNPRQHQALHDANRLFHTYLRADDQGRQLIMRVAEREAVYQRSVMPDGSGGPA